jgi:hypothetical protein
MIHQHPVTYGQLAGTILGCFAIVGMVALAYTAAIIALRCATYRKSKKGK